MSACFSLVAAARQAFASSTSVLGVHRSALRETETPSADQATLDAATLYRRWGVPLDVIGGMASTDFDSIFKLSEAMRAAVAKVTPDGLPPATWKGGATPSVRTAPSDDDIEGDVAAARPHEGDGVAPTPATVPGPGEPDRGGRGGGTVLLAGVALVVLLARGRGRGRKVRVGD